MVGKNRNSQHTRSLILETAANIIREKGLADLKIKTLADRTGKSRWTIYNHFGNLDGIKKELYQRHDYLTVHLEKIVSLFLIKQETAQVDILAHILTQHFDTLIKDPLTREFAMAEFLGSEPIISQMVTLRERRVAKIMRTYTSEGDGYGLFPLEFLFPTIFGGITFMAFQYRMVGEKTCFGAKFMEKEFMETLNRFIKRLIKIALSYSNQGNPLKSDENHSETKSVDFTKDLNWNRFRNSAG
ncbi:TetR/AcrR family transcriptional regulator [Olivibacter sp. XZL3]|uniref:TetR/AcrR family transcriptional regulator n=1 Tax=Olivibacter sp. XZL3 TaxID=1735116 RepID=UPI0010662838|nr:TetR/AcrR family transcriptional regulator [Olivibacter sp. XZL3]